ncbi:MAG: threonylcarbamoyl-AMP synthase [Candidatus Lambdaproteobacteria bacterium RIFOXYD1_FULL_56_27]|uniref:Threonylcarbamoyl-AMP synthase n=1 Tax=Candidatus Lambdaproteobacteria bacterium RIFOXYD2_FULL_56_26 TaxID=1817773 RepID=A0A1F6H0Q8_9PROT|nr:MAG: threonylcarbamoyl-AMP synthase [Candidatus Lambdaproteobacteria bacterium RIFOXYC1_FULL_56_13]OGH03976.1 MAG: threonylcarbamoyl-AMP synthase [Candidatus Lambdaproteobacteria bacterium RIFOXYD2_FULL_56_26]OGH08367.1 MAG: threonylcarbamoyl-AMP synthase [Candidatus Lambdaproteobacteria bacterium RIFOXYD1_FULL_56_27]
MLVEIHKDSPQARKLAQVVEVLENDGVVIFPTEATYVFACAIESKKAMKRIEALKPTDKHKPFTFVCSGPSQFEQYTKGIPTPLFRKIRSLIPGPYVFIFEASKLIPKVLLTPRSTVGVKMPNSPIALGLAEAMNRPIVTSSLPLQPDQDIWYPWSIEEEYGRLVDLIVDGGDLTIAESSVLDFSVDPPQIIRAGVGDLSWLEEY